MAKITYLLGAGASALALPTIGKNSNSEITGMEGLSTELLKYLRSLQKSNQFYQEYINLASECIEFGTPDILAKYLLETKQVGKYSKLKALISSYFSYKETDIVSQNQNVRNVKKASFDKRALTFLTTISSNSRLPENVKIITWNYDNQIELAAKKLSLHGDSNSLSSISGFNSWPNIYKNFNGIPFLLHLNGLAGYYYSERDLCSLNKNHINLLDECDKLLLSFAWETYEQNQLDTFLANRIELTKQMMRDTEILVIIGYSFPFFNRDIDKELIYAASGSLKKIYFQDPAIDVNTLYDKFPILLRSKTKGYDPENPFIKIPIYHISETSNYFIPYEF